MTVALTLVLAVVVGVVLGLLGGGGSILMVPLLVYVTGLDTKEAIATSLLVVGVTSATGAFAHARAGRVRWRTGAVFGAAGMAGAYVGGRVSEFVPGTVLLVGFAVMMAVTALAMLRGRRELDPDKVRHQLPVARVVLDGAVVGLVTGLVGAGGGFLVVPALALLGGLPMPVAVGTSLVVIAMKSGAGLAGYLSSVSIDWPLAAAVTAAAVAGSLLGGPLAGRVDPDRLRQAFGWFVLVMAAFVGLQEAPDAVRTHPGTYLAVGLGFAAAALHLRRRRTRRAATPALTPAAHQHQHQHPLAATRSAYPSHRRPTAARSTRQRSRTTHDVRTSDRRGPTMSTVSQIDVQDAHRRLQAGHTVLVDVREPAEFAAGHAPGAVSVPLGTLTADHVPQGMDVMMICRSGRRSDKAVRQLADAGRRALNVEGGMQAWHESRLSVQTGDGRPGVVA